ncbi:methylenetetrahydrofolate reductase [NAD(P)H] [Caproicibacterium argilliputei]|uniref:Methylenetetrahydrofolate reductase n=1 Tax=Caproicibacterium argilliputei TaxID=3030016 RepID=A0AA97D9T6_9FIRM|nr:methylenetetrahydrofolate reductase [NAD(P)H] [Caproicibacterium argilliputei]WOC31461.1 methylenetetrahydrofolate reductase [NAD(P)H] [Caproicibacterium argilliputei]
MISETLFQNHTVFSFEVFPPKRSAPIDTIYRTLDGLRGLRPDFISVTYGAAGSQNSTSTVALAAAIQNRFGMESVAHLPCLYLSKAQALETTDQLLEHGVQNILVLRGDKVPELPPQGDFPHAANLIAFLHSSRLHLLAACYPEVHPEAESAESDLQHLKEKTDAGANHLISQLFLDNACFYRFVRRARAAGITAPIEAGIMPVINRKQILHMTSLCGAALPEKFTVMMDKYGDNPEAMRDAGIAYAVDQIVDLVSHGVDGIHLYTMNNPLVARKISEATATLFH